MLSSHYVKKKHFQHSLPGHVARQPFACLYNARQHSTAGKPLPVKRILQIGLNDVASRVLYHHQITGIQLHDVQYIARLLTIFGQRQRGDRHILLLVQPFERALAKAGPAAGRGPAPNRALQAR